MHKTKKHTAAKPYKCWLCSWSFETEDGPQGLVQHIENIHKNANKIRCKYCNVESSDWKIIFDHISKDHSNAIKARKIS